MFSVNDVNAIEIVIVFSIFQCEFGTYFTPSSIVSITTLNRQIIRTSGMESQYC